MLGTAFANVTDRHFGANGWVDFWAGVRGYVGPIDGGAHLCARLSTQVPVPPSRCISGLNAMGLCQSLRWGALELKQRVCALISVSQLADRRDPEHRLLRGGPGYKADGGKIFKPNSTTERAVAHSVRYSVTSGLAGAGFGAPSGMASGAVSAVLMALIGSLFLGLSSVSGCGDGRPRNTVV